MDKATTIEHALDLLGEHDFIDNSGTQSIAMRHYAATLRECCSAHHWSFARRSRVLIPTEENKFTLPIDCLRVKGVFRTDTEMPYPVRVPHWQLIGRTIYAEQESIRLVYTADFTASGEEIPDAAPLFQQYVIHTLASRLAPTICGAERGVQLANNLMQIAAAYKHDALVTDRQQDGSNDQNHFAEAVEAMRENARTLRKYIR